MLILFVYIKEMSDKSVAPKMFDDLQIEHVDHFDLRSAT
jgi:hypothetical protein